MNPLTLESIDREFRMSLVSQAMTLMRRGKREGRFRGGQWREDAEDAAQETMIRVWRQMDRIDSVQSIGPWLFTICQRASVDGLRRRIGRGRRRPKMVALWHARHVAEPRMVDPVDQDERCRRLRRRARRYPYLARHVIDGVSYQCIADERGVSLSMVKVTIWEERRKLREQLAGMSPEMISKEKTIRRLTV